MVNKELADLKRFGHRVCHRQQSPLMWFPNSELRAGNENPARS